MLPEGIGYGKEMKLHLARSEGRNVVSGYGAGHVLVNGVRFERSLVVLPDHLEAQIETELDAPLGCVDSRRLGKARAVSF